MQTRVVVVDLDGTLINTNSFHRWMIFLFKKTLLKNPLDSFKLIYISLLRLSKQISHSQMKYKILQISQTPSYQDFIDEFVISLDTYLNHKVLKFVQNEDAIKVLATAAPELYANVIAKKYGFKFCLATPSTNTNEWYENIRENKKTSLMKLMQKIKIDKIDIVITDHHDDLAIIKLADEVFLVNPSNKTKSILQKELHNKTIII